MEAQWPTEAARVPRGLPPQRAWRWCLRRTLRDVRLAAARGRPMSLPNALRLLHRRWAAIRSQQATAGPWPGGPRPLRPVGDE